MFVYLSMHDWDPFGEGRHHQHKTKSTGVDESLVIWTRGLDLLIRKPSLLP